MTANYEPNPIAILLAEHERAARQFALFETALAALDGDSPDAIRESLDVATATITFLDTELEWHIRKEEEPLFPRLKAALPAGDRLIDEMVAEHDQARLKRDDLHRLLDELLGGHDDLRQERDRLRAAVSAVTVAAPSRAVIGQLQRAGRSVLQTLRIHFQNEEEIVFPLAADLLSREQLTTAGREMEAIDRRRSDATAPAVAPPVVISNLGGHLADLRASPEFAGAGRTARTLLTDGPVRLVLVALAAGGRLHQHRAPGPVTVHLLEGLVTVSAAGIGHSLQSGDLLMIPAGLLHEVDAAEASALLLTIAMPA